MNRTTVLLVDADEDSLTVYSALLRHEGYAVVLARDPEVGLELARRTKPDLVVTELFERTESGWRSIEALRGTPTTARIPVVALTARVLDEDRRSAVQSGCDLFLMKPIQPTELVRVVKKFLARSGGEAYPEMPA